MMGVLIGSVNGEQLIREGLKDRVTRLPPVTAAFRDRLDAESWGPSVKYILAEDIPQLEREDFKRMRPQSRCTTVVTPPPAPTAKPNRPPKPVNTFLMFCRYVRIMVDHPNTSAKDASKILGDMWQKLSEKDRASYIPMTELENQRRLSEWHLKENGLSISTASSGSSGFPTMVTAVTPSASTTTSRSSSPAAAGTPVALLPRLAPAIPSIEEADDADDDDADDGDEDNIVLETTV
ncbi:hypothetical protein BBJ28_00002798 [Nothophytophthora sp. Chile5]|nr:hypothetical protein BBJ28_00002798 [Nothophytophthora sp. Chile5]